MAIITELVSPRQTRSAPEPQNQSAPQRTSARMPGTIISISARPANPQPASESATAQPLRLSSPPPGARRNGRQPDTSDAAKATHAENLARARAEKAAVGQPLRPTPTVIKPPAKTITLFNQASEGIMAMHEEPKGYTDDAKKSAAQNRADMQAQVKNLQNMLMRKAEALRCQAVIRQWIKDAGDRLDPVHHKAWDPAASVDLEAVFREAEAAVLGMQARLGTAAEVESRSDSGLEETFFDALMDFASDSDSDTEVETGSDTHAEAPQVRSESPEPEPEPEPEIGSPARSTVSTAEVAGSAVPESPLELAEKAANTQRDGMAHTLLSLQNVYMGYTTSGVLGLVGNVRAMKRKIERLEEVLDTREAMLQGHADLVKRLADETLPTRPEGSRLKLWREAAEMDPEALFKELATSISQIKARMRKGVEHLIYEEGYSKSEIFSKYR
ncbi:hypothetical protein M4R22_08700 [Acidovorax sp. GBBC 3334]|uniref:hypothetical protein n=1 Tax=Acidovorax sp. GBBC 3334 TaxID=2940496 RepID=UPI0023042B2C|nr:hypothetical protein [Acidovorax sp. GBBC 3334]MDA8454840.1 hypothetical protein [Acidovorax sp. GBBC 3334]